MGRRTTAVLCETCPEPSDVVTSETGGPTTVTVEPSCPKADEHVVRG